MKTVLSIAGSDSSGGAGIQADLKTCEAFGVFGMSVVTVLTAQNTQGVSGIYEISPVFVKEQIETVLDDIKPDAIKIGMLFSNEIIDVVKSIIKELDIPIVFDPVFISKAGSKLLNDDAIENLRSMIELASICTPNLFEANQLFGNNLQNLSLCTSAILVKNQIKDGKSLDILYKDTIQKVFETEYLDTSNLHGTGCSFSSAIAANLALGYDLEEAIAISKQFIYNAIKNAPHIGHGKGPISHRKGIQE